MWEKGYQETDSVVSSVTTKAKGVAVTNTSQLGFRIWDVADYVIPAQVGLAVTSVRRQHFAGFVNIHWVARVCHLRALVVFSTRKQYSQISLGCHFFHRTLESSIALECGRPQPSTLSFPHLHVSSLSRVREAKVFGLGK